VQASDILLRNLDDSGLLRLTLNDPARRNALSEAMLGELGAAFADAGKNPPVRVVILAANGLAFCAGHDLKEMTAGPRPRQNLFQRGDDDVFRGHAGDRELPKPVIAEVARIATAAGCQLVASCDLASLRPPRSSARQGFTLGCSAPRPWSPCRATSAASMRWRCC
jgi:enoyl-CoA hydratase/carnithine racemase